jgi:Family of unknown function (DUF6459)
MSVHQAAEITEAADCDLDGIGVVEVPDVWPPLDGAEVMIPALAAGTVSAGRTRPQAAGRSWPQQFAVLLAETLTGARPAAQVLPWLSKRGSVQLHRLLPLFSSEHRPRVLRVLTTMPSKDVVEMTMVVLIGPRARALAVRLERAGEPGRTGWPDKLAARWLCTDIEAG